MALTWLRQSGYPVVTFTRQGTQVHVTQNMFLQTPELSTDLQDSEYEQVMPPGVLLLLLLLLDQEPFEGGCLV